MLRVNSSESAADAAILEGYIEIANRRANAHKHIAAPCHAFWFGCTKSLRWVAPSKLRAPLVEYCPNAIFVI